MVGLQYSCLSAENWKSNPQSLIQDCVDLPIYNEMYTPVFNCKIQKCDRLMIDRLHRYIETYGPVFLEPNYLRNIEKSKLT
jgi:hypothetical protein